MTALLQEQLDALKVEFFVPVERFGDHLLTMSQLFVVVTKANMS